jgi:hypothetical protein
MTKKNKMNNKPSSPDEYKNNEDLPLTTPDSSKDELKYQEVILGLQKQEIDEMASLSIKNAITALNLVGIDLIPNSKVLYGIFRKNSLAALRGLPAPQHDNLYSLISDPKLLTLAYKNLGSNEGATTEGPTHSADGISNEKILLLSKELKSQTFE